MAANKAPPNPAKLPDLRPRLSPSRASKFWISSSARHFFQCFFHKLHEFRQKIHGLEYKWNPTVINVKSRRLSKRTKSIMGFVALVESDKREGVHERVRGVEDPGIMDVLDAIRRLDGETYTVVSLEGDNGLKRMTIGGGNNGFYNVYIAVDIDREFHNLLNPDALPDSLTMLVTGGQAGNFPTTHCVDLQTAIKAAEAFFESGDPAPELQWEIDS